MFSRFFLSVVDILCVAAGLRSASLVEQLLLKENDIERIQSFFHHTARFNQLDLLRIGQDHVFIIHRELLLEDIRNYLKRSSKGLQRVFVNVDHHLPQPEVLPRNRYRVLEEYITDELLPEIQDRVECWDQADRPNRSLPTPSNVSMITLTGWLLGYPVVYVFPLKSASRKRSTRSGLEAEGRKHRLHEQKQWDVPGEYLDDETAPEDNEDDSSLNCLANQILVVTKVHLEPSSKVEGLSNHCLASFSYPFELAERWMDRTKVSPQSPCTTPLMPHSPTNDHRDKRDEGVEEERSYNYDSDNIADACDVEYPPSSETLLLNIKPAPMTSEVVRTLDGNMGSIVNPPLLPSPLHPYSQSQPQDNTGRGLHEASFISSPSPSSGSTPSFMSSPQLLTPFNNPDIHAAGRSFLHQLHIRFQNQTIWKTWQVGQQPITLPVVHM
ncbi:MAG: hypothetical protein J3Q66DRAFT_181187 [Benniella sp.]|nr:MAG: hypothetical protein J3Q66DRAFT_181187 [Benniella sp.]